METLETDRLRSAVELLLQRGNELFSCPCVPSSSCVVAAATPPVPRGNAQVQNKAQPVTTPQKVDEDDDIFELV
jgi:hypothetical protein